MSKTVTVSADLLRRVREILVSDSLRDRYGDEVCEHPQPIARGRGFGHAPICPVPEIDAALARVEQAPRVEWKRDRGVLGNVVHTAESRSDESRIKLTAAEDPLEGDCVWRTELAWRGEAPTVDDAKAAAERAAGVRS